ncbi:MAG: phosphatase PAP2 family protein [Chitinophagales bacterium]|nr:phosphatase PAP2 family protein [Chitinophagales bacterium]
MIDRLILWDYEAWLYLNTQWVNPVLDAIMPFVRNQWTWAPLYLFLLIFMPMNYKRKGFMWCVFFLLTFALGDFISASIIKPLYLRPRPCNNIHLKDITHLLVPCGSGYSFPSSHATNHFALGIFSAITFKHITKWIWPIGLLWAISVGYAQIYVGVHFPGDVLVGGLLGSIVAIITGSVFNRIYKLERKTATLAPPETS